MDKYDNYIIYTVSEFSENCNLKKDDFIKQVGRGKKERYYYNSTCTFDSETSHTHDLKNLIGWVYQWAFLIKNIIIVGRKPSEFIELLEFLRNYLGLYTERDPVTRSILSCRKLKFFVHNLSYDLQYFKDYFIKALKGFKLNNRDYHKSLSAVSDCFDISDSYAISGRSLEAWANDLKTPHKKLIGYVNYDSIHFQDDPLPRDDWLYMYNDVIVLRECIDIQNRANGNDFLTMPPTKTAYIRKYVKRCYNQFLTSSEARKITANNSINETVYSLLRLTFAGGYTHNNRYYTEETVKGNIKHRDYISLYPAMILLNKFPGGRFNQVSNYNLSKIIKDSDEYAFLIYLKIENCEIKNKNIVMPYLQKSKLNSKEGRGVYDNGRVLKFEGTFNICFTELDLLIFLQQYNFKYRIICCFRSLKKELPVYITEPTRALFKEKQELKNIVQNNKKNGVEDIEAERRLSFVKEQLNSIAGMLQTNPVRASYNFNFETRKWHRQHPNNYEMFETFTFLENDSSARNFSKYQFGVWITAWGRYYLFKILNDVIKEKAIYTDTDSCFYFSTPEIEEKIEEFNKEIIKRCEIKKAYALNGNKKDYLGLFEAEPEEISEFRGLHAKCYGYVYSNEKVKNKLSITVAGVPKASTDENGRRITREEELKSLDNLKTGFIFKKCGGTYAQYIEELPKVEKINGHDVEHASACIILKSEKTLNSEEVEDNIEYYAFNVT